MDWIYEFMNLNAGLSQNRLVSRASAFNVVSGKALMANYETLLTKCHFTPGDIYNIHETSVSTVMEPPKVLFEWFHKQEGRAKPY